ncbi:MAG: protein kinase [Candidatus Saccharimonas sp.]|nr:protein kinase [Planctomycetaceae bacterium]
MVVGPGSQLGPYQLLDKLGEGGMGAVYKARHTKLDKLVALKILPEHVMSRPDALGRFEREMKAVGKLSHPNVVQALDAGEFNGVNYLSMEYVEGQDLQVLVTTKGPMSVVNACKAIRQAAMGLAAAHKLGLIHRDIKPSNLFVTNDGGKIKILDMGLALLSQEDVPAALTSSGQCFGTPDYMAPEQWEDAHTCDARADLYSLGCTLFLLLAGRTPYGGDEYRTVPRKMKGHIYDPIPDLIALRPEVPAGLNAIYRKLLAKEPQDRFTSATELVEALVPFTRQSGSSPSSPVAPRQESRATIDLAKPTASDHTQPHSMGLPASAGVSRSETATEGEAPIEATANTSTWNPNQLQPQGAAMPQMLVEPPHKTSEHRVEPDQVDWLNLHVTTTTSHLARRTAKRDRRGWPMAVAFGAVSLVSLWAVYVITVKTPQGELVIHSDTAGITVKVRSDGEEVVQGWKMAKGTDNKQLIRTGQIEIELPAELVGEFTVTPSVVTLTKGKQEIVKIERKELPPASTKGTTNDQDREVAEWVLSVGGSLKVVKDGVTISLAPGAKLPASPFVIDFVDINAVEYKAKDKVIVDDELARFAGLKGLRTLYIHENPATVTDRGVAKLHDLPKLLVLHLNHTQVTDACLNSILAMPSLEQLYLGRTKVTPAVLPMLKSLPKLRMLGIGDWKFAPMVAAGLLELPSLRLLELHESWLTDAGIAFLRQSQVAHLYIEIEGMLSDDRLRLLATLPQLEGLGVVAWKHVESTDVTPSGFRTLAALPRLTNFQGTNFPFTDEHVSAIAEIKGLETFQVFHYGGTGSPMTDTGLEHLARLPKLKELILMRTQVTPAGLARFRAAKPDCQITTDVISPNLSATKPPTKNMAPHVALPNNTSALTGPALDRRATEWVLKHGGKCFIHNLELGKDAWMKPGDALPAGPVQLNVVQGNETMKNADLENLAGLQSITGLYLVSPSVDHGAIPHVARLKSLLAFNCWQTSIPTSALTELRELPFLTELTIRGEQVDDNWAFLGSLDSQWWLTVSGHVPSPQDFKAWAAFPQLHTLLFDTAEPVDAASVAEFQRKHPGCRIVVGHPQKSQVLGVDPVRQTILQLLPKGIEFEILLNNQTETRRVTQDASNVPPEGQYFYFRDVHVPRESPLTHEDLLPLANCSFDTLYAQGRKQADVLLQALPPRLAVYAYKLSGSDLTDEGLKRLHGISSLKNLDITNTHVTADGVKEFHTKNPHCEITSDFGLITPNWSVPKPSGTSNASQSPDRRVAEWVLAHGGTCFIRDLDKGADATLKPGDSLPQGPIMLSIVNGSETMKNADLENLAGLQNITRLYLSSPTIDNDAIPHVIQLKSLLEINWDRTNVRTSALTGLRELPFLTSLGIGGGQVNDKWAFLASLDSMWNLAIAGLVPGPPDFEAWAKFPQLHTIYLDSLDPVDATTVVELQRKLPGCRIVVGPVEPMRQVIGIDPVRQTIVQLLPKGIEFEILLNNFTETRRVTQETPNLPADGKYFYFHDVHLPRESPLTHEDLLPLANCSFDTLYAQKRKQADVLLQALPPRLAVYDYNLSGSDLTDEGLKHLYGISFLKYLVITNTHVTADGVKVFHTKNPHCQITSDFGYISPNWSAPKPSAK